MYDQNRTILRLIAYLLVVPSLIYSGAYAQNADEPVIYEPFDYPAGKLDGQSGASEKGLDGAWHANAETLLQLESLRYSTLPTLGASIGGLQSINRYGGSRAVSASALSATGLLKDGATLWFSALMGLGEGCIETNTTLCFALANNQFCNQKYAYWIEDDNQQRGEGVGVILGRITDARGRAVNGRAAAAKFQDVSQGKGLTGIVYGTSDDVSPKYVAGQYGLIVGKITWGAGAGDTISIYYPGEDLALPGSPASTLTVDVDQSAFDTITFARGEKILFDEIRFGPSYESVTGAGTARKTFSEWIAGYSVGDQTALDDDADGDGYPNGVENFFGTDPSQSGDALLVAVPKPDGGKFAFSHPRRGVLASDLQAVYRWSSDRAVYTDNGASFQGTTVNFTTQANTPEQGTTTVIGTITGKPLSNLYVTVQITQTP